MTSIFRNPLVRTTIGLTSAALVTGMAQRSNAQQVTQFNPNEYAKPAIVQIGSQTCDIRLTPGLYSSTVPQPGDKKPLQPVVRKAILTCPSAISVPFKTVQQGVKNYLQRALPGAQLGTITNSGRDGRVATFRQP